MLYTGIDAGPFIAWRASRCFPSDNPPDDRAFGRSRPASTPDLAAFATKVREVIRLEYAEPIRFNYLEQGQGSTSR